MVQLSLRRRRAYGYGSAIVVEDGEEGETWQPTSTNCSVSIRLYDILNIKYVCWPYKFFNNIYVDLHFEIHYERL